MTWCNIHSALVEDWAVSLPLTPLQPVHLSWLEQQGVSEEAISKPLPILVAKGSRGHDGVLDHEPDGPEWLTFEEQSDLIYWRPKTGEIAWEFHKAFALGEVELRNPWTTALGQPLRIYASPLDWLRAKRRGMFVIQWGWAFDWLRDVGRIEVAPEIMSIYQRAMQPLHMPKVSVLPATSNSSVAS